MTIPRELGIKMIGGKPWLASFPVRETSVLVQTPFAANDLLITKDYVLPVPAAELTKGFQLDIDFDQDNMDIILSNAKGEELVLGYDKKTNQYFIDRSHAGVSAFYPDFAKRSFAPGVKTDKRITLTLIVDKASVELFAEGGLTVMTGIFFPGETYNKLSIRTEKGLRLYTVNFNSLGLRKS